ncbi:MAG: SLC13 family permease [Pirellulales bacterium]
MLLPPLAILAIGICTVLGLIIALRVNAFIALITAAIVVSLLSAGSVADKISRVAAAFGAAAGGIGIVIAMAAIIGKCMLDSGAADRVVRAFLRALGVQRAPLALMGSGFVLAVPVFFDTVFYLLVPLARSLYRQTSRNYLKYILAISAGGAITHTLVPPTPGPLLMASNLNIDVGMMILIGSLVALPAAFAGLMVSSYLDRRMPIAMRQIGSEPEPEPLPDDQLPSLAWSLAPVLLPVVMISTNTVLTTMADAQHVALLSVEDVTDWPELRSQFRQQAAQEDPTPGGRIVEAIESGTRNVDRRQETLALINQQEELSAEQRAELSEGLNRFVIADKSFHQEQSFLGVSLDDETKELLRQNRLRMKQVEAERLNRKLLELSYPGLVAEHEWFTPERRWANTTSLLGDANLALLISAVIAMWVLKRQRGLTRYQLAQAVEVSLMSGGVIILITAGGGAFGAMLTVANVGEAINDLFQLGPESQGKLLLLFVGFLISSVLKVAQGSSTVAMITGSAMLAGIADPQTLGFHPVYLATSIGAGSLVGSWMNDSGFWIFAKMGGLTEVEALKSWTPMLVVLGVVAFGVTVILAMLMPLI